MNRLEGPYLRHLIEVYEQKLVRAAFGRSAIPWEQRLCEAYNQCVHGNLIDLRAPFQALEDSRNLLTDFAADIPNFPHV